MSRNLSSIVAATLSFAALLGVGASPVLAGSEGSGGGDTYAIQFVSYGNQLARFLDFWPSDGSLPLNSAQLRQTVQQTRVQSTLEPLMLDGRSVDAINTPAEKLITLSRQGWDGKNLLLQRTLVMHEYLGIMRIEDRQYQVSSRIVATLPGMANPCAQDEYRFQERATEFFTKRGTPPCRGNSGYVGNGTLTLRGSYLKTLRGFSVGNTGSAAALLMIGECNEATGNFEELQFSASGADLPNFPDAKRYWDDYCGR